MPKSKPVIKFTKHELKLQAIAKEGMERDMARATEEGVTLQEYRLLKAIFNDPNY
jgi:hypothetical protein